MSLEVIFAFLLLEFRNVLEPNRHFTLRVGSSVRDADIRDGFIVLSYEHRHSAIGIVMLPSDAINVSQKYSVYDVVCSSMMLLLFTDTPHNMYYCSSRHRWLCESASVLRLYVHFL